MDSIILDPDLACSYRLVHRGEPYLDLIDDTIQERICGFRQLAPCAEGCLVLVPGGGGQEESLLATVLLRITQEQRPAAQASPDGLQRRGFIGPKCSISIVVIDQRLPRASERYGRLRV